MSGPRDSQRAKVYGAESLIHTMFDRGAVVELMGSQVTLPVERKFASLDSVQSYVDRVLALDWVRTTFSRATAPVAVRARAGNSAAHYEDGVIAIPLHRNNSAWALREWVIVHELAHHLDPTVGDDEAHGPEFIDRYLTLVDGIIGPEAAFVLRATMDSSGVRFA